MISAEHVAELWSAAIIDSATGGQGMSDVLIFARAVEREAYEVVASACEEFPEHWNPERCAAAIRALKEKV